MRVSAYHPSIKGPIAFVGEAPGAEEDAGGQPFLGGAGRVFGAIANSAGINIGHLEAVEKDVKGVKFDEVARVGGECLITNVFDTRPTANNVELFFDSKEACGLGNPYPPIAFGSARKYLKPEHFGQLARLREELQAYKPNVCVALGATALWALCGVQKIGAHRGSVAPSSLVEGMKVLPTWHPAAVMRQWDYFIHSVCDLIKARREAQYPELRFRPRRIYINPTLQDIYDFDRQYLQNADLYSIDIENPGGLLHCIGIAPSADVALVVPFVDKRRKDWCYWQDPLEEKDAWWWICEVCKRFVPKMGQNFVAFDTNVLFSKYRMPMRHIKYCTMTQHHAYQPELIKDLGFLTSIYCNEPAYKTIRPKGFKTDKREE